MQDIYILGSHITQFGELWDRSLLDLVSEASYRSVDMAGIDDSQIEAVFVANKAAGNYENQHHLGALVSQLFKHYPPATRVEGACASGALALVAAEQALASGMYQTVLVVGVEKMTDVSSAETTAILAGAADVHQEYGSTFPGLYAMLAQQHIKQYGTTREQLSSVAAKNHTHALTNPQAQYHKKISIEAVSTSQLVADPLRLLDCSPITDGAAAVVLSTKHPSEFEKSPVNGVSSAAKTSRGVVKVAGWGHGQDSLHLAGRASLTSLAATKRATQQLFDRVAVELDQVKVAEVHDCFTIAELLALEDIGFFEPGQAGKATLDGETSTEKFTQDDSHDQKKSQQQVIVNPSGGLKACGHPVGATGIKQVAFLAEYLQQQQLEYGLTHNVGGSGATAVVHLLQLVSENSQQPRSSSEEAQI